MFKRKSENNKKQKIILPKIMATYFLFIFIFLFLFLNFTFSFFFFNYYYLYFFYFLNSISFYFLINISCLTVYPIGTLFITLFSLTCIRYLLALYNCDLFGQYLQQPLIDILSRLRASGFNFHTLYNTTYQLRTNPYLYHPLYGMVGPRDQKVNMVKQKCV